MSTALQKQAIEAAIKGDWEGAIEINTNILRENKEDVEALNRLAYALANTGETKKAMTITRKALKIDPINPIACKLLKRWEEFENGNIKTVETACGHDFLEEPGKTKLLKLINLGRVELLRSILPGQKVSLVCHQHRVCVNTMEGKHLGRLADDMAARIKGFIKKGNEYRAIVKSINEEEVVIFVRETKRVKSLKHVPSFPVSL